ncbi:MAG TPA: hypothetical protein VHM30_06900 [Gemmatimonadaceae bacterium]|nr:hypothetical protein [Gemmatimonadaceae bacterium]
MPTSVRAEHRGALPAPLAALLAGAVLGVLILGVGGRLAMRGVTLWEGRTHLFSVAGTLTVMMWGAGFGAAAGTLRFAVDRAFARWGPERSQLVRAATAWAITLAIALVVLTPWTAPRLALFPPVLLLYLTALESVWRRRSRTNLVEGGMRPASLLLVSLILSATPAAAQLQPTYDAVVRGTSCKQSMPAPGKSQRDCEYQVGDGLAFVIAGVGRADAAITVTKASGYDTDYYVTFGMRHGCVVVNPGTKATRAALRSGVRPDIAFVSPKTGKVYTTSQACSRGA